jgi:hypothetical protein
MSVDRDVARNQRDKAITGHGEIREKLRTALAERDEARSQRDKANAETELVRMTIRQPHAVGGGPRNLTYATGVETKALLERDNAQVELRKAERTIDQLKLQEKAGIEERDKLRTKIVELRDALDQQIEHVDAKVREARERGRYTESVRHSAKLADALTQRDKANMKAEAEKNRGNSHLKAFHEEKSTRLKLDAKASRLQRELDLAVSKLQRTESELKDNQLELSKTRTALFMKPTPLFAKLPPKPAPVEKTDVEKAAEKAFTASWDAISDRAHMDLGGAAALLNALAGIVAAGNTQKPAA